MFKAMGGISREHKMERRVLESRGRGSYGVTCGLTVFFACDG